MAVAPQAAVPERIEIADVEGRPGDHTLASNAIGLPGVLFLIVTGAAPIAAMLFNVPIAVLGAGWAAPAAFLVATVVLTIFAVGYIEMARRVTAAGGFYSFVSHGFGQVAAMGTALLIALCYLIFSAAVFGAAGYFASTTLDDWFGIHIAAWVLMLGFIGITSLLAWFHVELTAKVLGVFLVTEVIGLVIFSLAVLVSGGDSGLTAEPLNPVEIFDNQGAVATFGAGAAGVALFAAFWSWVGFEMAPNYAEESRDPKRIAAPATYISVIGLGLLYTFVSLMFVTGWGMDGTAPGVNGQFEGEFASAFYPLTDRYFGSSLTTLFELLIVTGSFACATAFFNTSSRYLFSMGREGLLPRRLARTHATHKSPYVASMVVTALVFAYVIGFVAYDSSDLAMLLKLATWSPLLGVLGILAIQALVSFAIIRYFWTKARDGFHPWKTLIAPLIGGCAQLGACYLLIDNRALLSGAGDVLFVRAIPWVVIGIFALGVMAALYYRARDAVRYQAIGRFVHEEA